MSNELPEIVDAEPQQLASVQARLGSFLLDCALLVVTLFIGWLFGIFIPGRQAKPPQSES